MKKLLIVLLMLETYVMMLNGLVKMGQEQIEILCVVQLKQLLKVAQQQSTYLIQLGTLFQKNFLK